MYFRINHLNNEEIDIFISEFEKKISFVVSYLNILDLDLSKQYVKVIPKDSRNIYLIDQSHYLFSIIIKTYVVINSYKTYKNHTFLSDENLYELWLLADVLTIINDYGLVLDSNKINSLKGSSFRQTFFELLVASSYIKSVHIVNFISSSSSETPDLLINNDFVIECKTTNPTQLKTTYELWNNEFFNKAGAVIKQAKSLEIKLYKFMNRVDWEKFIKQLKFMIDSNINEYESLGNYNILITQSDNFRSKIDIDINNIMEEKILKNIDSNIAKAKSQIQEYGKHGVIYLNISNQYTHRSLLKNKHDKIYKLTSKVFLRSESNLVFGLLYGFDEMDTEFRNDDYEDYHYNYIFGEKFIENSQYIGVGFKIQDKIKFDERKVL
jgi:hypothetical protein